MCKKKVILIGRINKGKPPIGGETAKNQSLLLELQKYCIVYPLDFYQNKKHPWIFLQTLFLLLFHPSAALILSTTAANVYKLIQTLLMFHRKGVIIHWIIGGVFDQYVKDGVYKASYFNSITYNLAESKLMVANLKRCGIGNAVYVPNFRHIKYYPNIDRRLALLNKQPTYNFVFVSRIMESKGVGVLLDAVEILNSRGLQERFHVDFYGNVDSQYHSIFTDRMELMDNVSYKGFMNLLNDEGYDLLATYHCLIFPTFHQSEGFAGILIDAFIAGTPIIASDWGHNTEIIENNRTGLIFPSKNSVALADTMQDVILNKVDICSLSINAQKESLLYDTKNVISEKFLKQIGIL